MPFSVYDSHALRLLSEALNDVWPDVERYWPTPLSPAESADIKHKIAQNLTRSYDNGEREPEALRRAALKGVLSLGRQRKR